MKSLLLAFSFIASVTAIESATACSMPLPTVRQLMNLEQSLESEEFKAALKEQMQGNLFVKIESIDFKKGVSAHLSNGCVIHTISQYEAPTHPGMCPRFKGVKVETVCE